MKTLALSLAAAAVTSAAVALAAEPPAAIPDRSLGLSKTSVFETPPPPEVKENDSAPGERPVPPRAYAGAAPAVPHGTADFLPITKDGNACVDCHAVATKVAGEPTPIPASHYVDLRRAPRTRGKDVAGARWVCTACHVARHDVAPLVPNAGAR